MNLTMLPLDRSLIWTREGDAFTAQVVALHTDLTDLLALSFEITRGHGRRSRYEVTVRSLEDGRELGVYGARNLGAAQELADAQVRTFLRNALRALRIDTAQWVRSTRKAMEVAGWVEPARQSLPLERAVGVLA